VVLLGDPAEPSPPTPYRPIPSITMLVEHPSGACCMLRLAVRATAAWSPRARCWTFGIAGAELDGFLARADAEGCSARLAVLALGGGDRIVPNAPPPTRGLFLARASTVERGALRTFGLGADRRLVFRVVARPWRHLTLLDALTAP